MKNIIVTGGSGKAGRAVVQDLKDHGYVVEVLDQIKSESAADFFTFVDLTDYGQTVSALRGTDCQIQDVDAVVHLAAIPGPGRRPDEVTFQVNTISTYNVFRAATHLGLKRIVWASSETILGLPFDTPPVYAPIDEEAPSRPEWSYSLSKVMGEEMARQFSRWYADIPIIGLRYSNIMEPGDYASFPKFSNDPKERSWNLWGYVDARDVAQATRKALTADISGARNYIVAAADTVMLQSSKELMTEIFPGTPVKEDLGEHETLLSIDKARLELGYDPQYSWRDQQ
jgi:nucleoside-diphosphate-sugar epimerase